MNLAELIAWACGLTAGVAFASNLYGEINLLLLIIGTALSVLSGIIVVAACYGGVQRFLQSKKKPTR
jgi:hypothetical protein